MTDEIYRPATPLLRALGFALALAVGLSLPGPASAQDTPSTPPPPASAADAPAAPPSAAPTPPAAEAASPPPSVSPSAPSDAPPPPADAAAAPSPATPDAPPATSLPPLDTGNAVPDAAPVPEGTGDAPSGTGTLPSVDRAHLPSNLTPWGMFEAADNIVKGVMIGLAFASLVTWTVWLAKTLELMSVKRRIRRGLAEIDSATDLADAARKIGRTKGVVAAQIDAAVAELSASMHLHTASGIKERIASRLDRLEAAAGRNLSRGTGVLATIGATAPFVGLFGTVWGIMNSFIGISKAQTTNLAVVAPGIAEALLATAIGLVAAIPAVIIYNLFARQITGIRGQVADGSAAVMRLVSRELDRAAGPSHASANHAPLSRAAE